MLGLAPPPYEVLRTSPVGPGHARIWGGSKAGEPGAEAATNGEPQSSKMPAFLRLSNFAVGLFFELLNLRF